MRRIAFAVAVVAILASGAGSALGGGSWFDPVKDRYEPGDEATLVGYTGGGAYGWIEDGPFFGYLVGTDQFGTPDSGSELREPLGELELTETDHGGYAQLRAAITFTVPADLEPGTYGFDYCNAACDERLGDLVGGVVYVGVDPEYDIKRSWPADDPEWVHVGASETAVPDDQTEGWVSDAAATTTSAGPTTTEVDVVAAPSAEPDEGAGVSTMLALAIPVVVVAALLALIGRRDPELLKRWAGRD